MAPIPPRHQKLIIPRKNTSRPADPHKQGDADINYRAIEMWANEGIVRKLIAGSGITLTPSDGVDTGTGIEIASSGGGTGMTFVTSTCGMDSTLWPFAQWLGPTDPSVVNRFDIGPFQNPTPASPLHVTFASSWITGTGGGQSIVTLPEFTVSPFSNAGSTPVTFNFYIGAWDFDASYTNFAQYQGVVNVSTAGGTVQCTTGDLTAISAASGDLSLVAGVGQSGNGLVSAGAVSAYIGSISGSFDIAASTTFT